MNRFAPLLIAAGLSLTPLSAAHALCVYDGRLYAQTTVRQELADADLAVKARVVSAVSHGDDTTGYWTLYQLETVATFKGSAPARFSLFTHRDSGGFYMDRDGGRPDVGGEYLLFLNRGEMQRGDPREAREAFRINYSCGRSGPWGEVAVADQLVLGAAAMRGS